MSLKELQKKIDELITNFGGYWPPLSMLSAIVEELGEVARELNRLEGFKPKKNDEKDINLGEEIADIIVSIICLANYYNINLDGELSNVLIKYQNRDSKRFENKK